MQRQDFRFADRLRVRWAEIDAQKIVFNGHYLMYVDTAVAGYWRALALPYAETMHVLGGDLYVKKATLEYHASARYEDMLEVGLRCVRIGKSSILFEAGVFRADELLVSGELVYVFANPNTQTSLPVPDALRQAFEGFEAGEPMLSLAVAPWADCETAVTALRRAVFVGEQSLPESFVVDAADAHAWHVTARNRLGRTVGAARLTRPAHPAGQPEGAVSRVAVDSVLRGSGIGKRLIDQLETLARAQGFEALTLQAQRSAVGCFERLQFQRQGEPELLLGREHQVMRRPIRA